MPRRPDQIYDLHGRPLLVSDVGFASTVDGMPRNSTLAQRNGLAGKRHSLMPELAAARNQLVQPEHEGSLSTMNKTQTSGFGANQYNSLLKKKASPRRANARAPFPRHASTRPAGYGQSLVQQNMVTQKLNQPSEVQLHDKPGANRTTEETMDGSRLPNILSGTEAAMDGPSLSSHVSGAVA